MCIGFSSSTIPCLKLVVIYAEQHQFKFFNLMRNAVLFVQVGSCRITFALCFIYYRKIGVPNFGAHA